MKNYKITVNGKSYDVTVEETGAAPAAAPAQAAPAQPKATASAGATTVKAPMPGTILDIKVSTGAAVKKGDVLCILEAMKMENDICAPADGTVDAILVNKGDSVEVNAAIIALK
ncbi:MAG: biotin/lipoyl-binding protein [Ruminococcaceae bacterium]|nr:biotin/lipoyl-binding protein [Oscillospiraceae bacterium]